jgi:hypothetical protein
LKGTGTVHYGARLDGGRKLFVPSDDDDRICLLAIAGSAPLVLLVQLSIVRRIHSRRLAV